MSEPRENLHFGAIAIKLGLTTLDKVDEVLRFQEKSKAAGIPTKKFGEVMVEKGYLTADQVKQIFQHQGTQGGHTQMAGYKILTKIGQGAMGTIYKAQQISMDRLVAIKVLSPKYAMNPSFRDRFFREARAVAKLNHPNIIQGIDVGESNGIQYFAMEYVDGPTVGELLKRGGAMDEKRAIHIVMQIARALSSAFQHGIIHRDIKPDNIMVTREQTAKLCDLGLAKIASDESRGAKVGMSMGTPFYISPEAARGDADIDTRSDIYSLGATFFHMVTGDVPFPAENAAGAITRHLTDSPPLAGEKNPLVSGRAEYVILRMLQKQREMRHQTPSELLKDLELIAAGHNPAGYSPQPIPPAKKPQLKMGDNTKVRLIKRVRRMRR